MSVLYVVGLMVIGYLYDRSGYEYILEPSLGKYDFAINIICLCLFAIWIVLKLIRVRHTQSQRLELRNRKLAAQNQELQLLVKQNNLKTKLLSVVTHDLRSSAYTFKNLTAKINYLIKKGKPEQLSTLGTHFENQGEKLIHNIENLLAWVVSQQESIEADFEDFKLRKSVEEVIENLFSPANNKSIGIINKIDETKLICSDKNILKIIIHNLVHNAIKYSPNHSKITIEEESQNNFYNIIITDEGKGLDQAALEKILTYQTQATSKISNQGYGIGLNICFSFIKVLKGELVYKNRKEGGLQVTIQLPMKEASVVLESDAIV